MKIGTLNYHHAYNYGAVFQAAALQHIITSLGHDCEIIDYRNQSVEDQYNFKPIFGGNNPIASMRANLVISPFIKKKKANFENWFNEYKKTEIIKRDKLAEISNRFDKIIVGSDQVWNMKCQGHDPSFFLDFTQDSKKIAYAASFGTYYIQNDDIDQYKEYLFHIPHISVREDRGSEIVHDLIGRDVPCTMDPVLLVGKDYWISRSYPKRYNEKYIFVYQLGHEGNVNRFAKTMSKNTKLPIVYITVHLGNIVKYGLSDKNCSSVSPEEFLCLLTNASYVVTNSFHAVALSMAFEKEFYAIANGDAKASYNTRIFSLLSRYGLQDRIKNTYDSESQDSIDYSDYFEKIENDRRDSINFLLNAIEK